MKSTGNIGFKGTEISERGRCAVAVPVSSPLSQRDAAQVCPRHGGLWGKGERLQKRGFLSGLGCCMEGAGSGRINPMTLSHSHAFPTLRPADWSYSSSSLSAGCIAARLCLDRERMKYRT